MNKLLLICLLFSGLCFGQKTTVADLEIKLEPGATEELMYGFAAGDRVIFTLEPNGAPVTEVTVMQYPDVVKYRNQEIKKEEKNEFAVTDKSIFVFKFINKAKGKRSCKLLVQRIAKNSDTRNFNTAVKWVTVQDTIYNSVTKDAVAGYDTLYVQKTRRVIASQKKYEEAVLDKTQRVNAKTSLAETKAAVAFTLPANSITKDETKKVVAWAYWVGVGKESNEYWNQNRKMIVEGVKGVATYFTSPLGGIAAGALTSLALPVNGEDVQYAVVNEFNSTLFFKDKTYKSYDDGKGIAAYKRFVDATMLQGRFYVVLANDNLIQPLDVNVKVSAIIEHTRYKDERYTDLNITPRYEKKIMREPQIVTAKIPVTFDYK